MITVQVWGRPPVCRLTESLTPCPSGRWNIGPEARLTGRPEVCPTPCCPIRAWGRRRCFQANGLPHTSPGHSPWVHGPVFPVQANGLLHSIEAVALGVEEV